MPTSLRAVPCLSAEVRCAPQAALLAPACADADGLEIPSSACNRAFRGFAWRYSDRYHEDLSSCVLYSQLRSCSVFSTSCPRRNFPKIGLSTFLVVFLRLPRRCCNSADQLPRLRPREALS